MGWGTSLETGYYFLMIGGRTGLIYLTSPIAYHNAAAGRIPLPPIHTQTKNQPNYLQRSRRNSWVRPASPMHKIHWINSRFCCYGLVKFWNNVALDQFCIWVYFKVKWGSLPAKHAFLLTCLEKIRWTYFYLLCLFPSTPTPQLTSLCFLKYLFLNAFPS